MSWFDGLPRVDGRFGFPSNLSAAFAQAASAINATVLVRAPGAATTQLLQERYDAKGYFIKGKSCTWGPMAGFVCMNPLLNKKGSAAWAFNREHHRDYLKTLLATEQLKKEGILLDPTVSPWFLDDVSPDDAALQAVIARAGRPLWISDNQRVQLELIGAMTPDPTYYASSSAGRAGIAANSPARPSVALEFVLRPVPSRQLWALYQGAIYQREFGDITAIDAGRTRITLKQGQGAAFPSGAPFPVRLTNPDVPTAAPVLATVTVAGDVLTATAPWPASTATVPGVAVGWGVESGWRAAAPDPLLDSVIGSGAAPRQQFVDAYGQALVGPTPAGGDEVTALTAMRTAFRNKFTSQGLSALPDLAAPSLFWPIVGMQNPYPPYTAKPASPNTPDLTYLNAVTGDYDLAAVWPVAVPDEEIVRISEMRWKRPPLPPNQTPEWWLSSGLPLFVPIDSKPFAVQSTRLPGLIIEFIPSGQQLTSGNLESGQWGNANNMVLAAVQWANSFAANEYGEGTGSSAPVNPNDPKIRNPPNVAFHSDEGGRPGIEGFDWPFAGFLPKQLFDALGNPVGNFVLNDAGQAPGPGNPLDDFLTTVATLASMSRVLVHSAWLGELLEDDARADEVIWLLIRGAAEVPAGDPRLQLLPADFSLLRTQLRGLVAPTPQGQQPPLAEQLVQTAVTLTVPGQLTLPGRGNPQAP